MSERQLHRLFQASGLTVSSWIKQARLERCAADLCDPRQRERSITEIAFEHGFNDSAHFSRSFREFCGSSAREFRSAALKESFRKGLSDRGTVSGAQHLAMT